VLRWHVTSGSTLTDALYRYDAIGRLHAQSLREASSRVRGRTPSGRSPASATRPAIAGPSAQAIEGYLRLGPLGTALLPSRRPRALLIDEIDKSDIDLPNDLLTIFETGSYEIIELARRAAPSARVMTADGTKSRVEVRDGTVTCREFPLVIMTSNGEREFPPAFLRRCLTLSLKQPATEGELSAIVAQHLSGVVGGNGGLPEQSRRIIAHFFQRRDSGLLANDQLLNAIFLCHHALLDSPPGDVLALADQVMPYLSGDQPNDG
jgi:MoxR-like ATPase